MNKKTSSQIYAELADFLRNQEVMLEPGVKLSKLELYGSQKGSENSVSPESTL